MDKACHFRVILRLMSWSSLIIIINLYHYISTGVIWPNIAF